LKAFNKLTAGIFSSHRTVLAIYVLVTIAVSIQQLLLPGRVMESGGNVYTEYNNYIIFKQSYFHLIQQMDLYSFYLSEQWDLFKYSPAFALSFGLLAYLPDAIGLTLWNLINALVLFAGIMQLPKLPMKARIAAALFIIIEMVTSLQNSQSNALIVGLLVLAFCLFERDQIFLACLCVTFTVFIKIFGLLAFAIAIFYPNKIKTILYTILCFAIFTFIPLVVVAWDQFVFLYQSWWDLLVSDHTISYGLSMIGWLTSWFGFTGNKNIVVLLGLVLLLLPFIRWKHYGEFNFRIIVLSSILIWMVIFNHKAESPSFIIAMAGVAMWYFSSLRTNLNWALVLLAFVFTSLSPTDIFPKFIQKEYFDPFAVKAVPCIFIWIKITYDLLFNNFQPQLARE
jgi:hypothetical protein